MNRLFGRLALLAAVAAVGLVAGAAPLYRYAGFDLPNSFALMKYGVYAAAAASIMAVLSVVFSFVARSSDSVLSIILAFVLSGASAYVPVSMLTMAQKIPPIHDITTDTANPPPFVAIAPLRADAKNGVAYNTDAGQQKIGYPDIEPLIMPDVSPADMFKRADAAAKAMGWEIVAAVPEEGRIEATDTTKWWGFKDDVVIRIVAEGTGSRLDIRSMSRVGQSDLGKNAERIRAFVAAVREAK